MAFGVLLNESDLGEACDVSSDLCQGQPNVPRELGQAFCLVSEYEEDSVSILVRHLEEEIVETPAG